MSDAADMIVPLLREMRSENAQLHAAAQQRVEGVEARLGKIEAQLVSFRHALSADSLMSKLVTGEFEERIATLEQKVSQFEGRS